MFLKHGPIYLGMSPNPLVGYVDQWHSSSPSSFHLKWFPREMVTKIPSTERQNPDPMLMKIKRLSTLLYPLFLSLPLLGHWFQEELSQPIIFHECPR